MPSASEMVNELTRRYLDVLADPLRPPTRRIRRALLGASIGSIAVVKADLVPRKIPAFGIDLQSPDHPVLLCIAAVVVFYFTVTFLIYCSSDIPAKLVQLRSIDAVLAAADKEHSLVLEEFHRMVKTFSSATDSTPFPDGSISVESSRRYVLALKTGVDKLRRERGTQLGLKTSIGRVLWEFATPLATGIYALVVLWSGASTNNCGGCLTMLFR